MNKINDLEDQIRRLSIELQTTKHQLKIAKNEIQYTEEQKEIATILHKELCTFNHTDGCAWYYAENDWNEYTHKEYMNMAVELLKYFDKHQIKLFLKCMKEKYV